MKARRNELKATTTSDFREKVTNMPNDLVKAIKMIAVATAMTTTDRAETSSDVVNQKASDLALHVDADREVTRTEAVIQSQKR